MEINPKIIALAQVFPCELFLVGGACRDLLMQNDPNDWDCASELRPFSVLIWAQMIGIKAIPTGLDHGTITLLWEDLKVEITTFRSERNCDGRHAQVEWSNSILEDLSRRDLTINAIAINLRTLEVIDPHNGKEDIANGIIRFVGNPLERAEEDFLRLLRAIRFAARFRFEIEETSAAACQKLGYQIPRIISWERIRDEFEKAFESGNGKDFLQTAEETGILSHLIGQSICLKNFTNVGEWWTTVYLSDNYKSVESFCKKWKLPNSIKSRIIDLIHIQEKLPQSQQLSEIRVLQDSLKAVTLDSGARFWNIDQPLIYHPRLQEKPWITGQSLLAKGHQPSSQFSDILREALKNQMDRSEQMTT